MSWKKSPLVRSKIVGLFVNRLTAEYMYSGRNEDFHAKSSDAIIFETKEFFSIFYIVSQIYMKSSLSISEIIDSKRGAYLSV